MIDYVIEIDSAILLFFNSLNHSALDQFVKAFSGQWPWVPMYIAIAGALVWRYGWRRGLLCIAAIGLAVGLSDFVTATLIRPMVQRLRPANLANPLSELVHIVDGYRGGRYGFPSCHAANSLALAVASSLLMGMRSYTLFIYIWAAFQCYSRMYLGVHYFGDLLVGGILGGALGYFAFWLLARNKRVGERLRFTLANPRPTPWWPVPLVALLITVLLAV